jgi:WD40 repeat protein
LAVCRDTGAINFYEGKTRERLTEMAVKRDPKVNPNTEVGTVTAIAFRPTPHPKLGEVFAVTHKNGYKVGAVGVGIPADTGVHVDGIDPSFTSKGLDPTQIVWVSDDTLAWSNGSNTSYSQWRAADKEGVGSGWPVPSVERGQPVVLVAVPGQKAFLTSDGDFQKTTNGLHVRSENDAIPRRLPNGLSQTTFELTRQLLGHKSRPTHGAVAKDGKRIVTGDEGGTLIVWEGEKFDEKRRIELGPTLAALALAPDGKTAAVLRTRGVTWTGTAANRSSTVFQLYVFDATAPPAKPMAIWTSEMRELPGKLNGPVSLAFSPDGKTLLAAFADPYTDDKVYGKIPPSVGVKVWERVPKK